MLSIESTAQCEEMHRCREASGKADEPIDDFSHWVPSLGQVVAEEDSG